MWRLWAPVFVVFMASCDDVGRKRHDNEGYLPAGPGALPLSRSSMDGVWVKCRRNDCSRLDDEGIALLGEGWVAEVNFSDDYSEYCYDRVVGTFDVHGEEIRFGDGEDRVLGLVEGDQLVLTHSRYQRIDSELNDLCELEPDSPLVICIARDSSVCE